MAYLPAENRYDDMLYNRCGRSGLKLPAISLGLWHNFGDDTSAATARAICRTAFDLGITHFDLANNYGPPPGSAEEMFGEILRNRFRGLSRRADRSPPRPATACGRGHMANGAAANICSPASTRA